MRNTMLALGLGSLLLAGCAADPSNAEASASRDDAYTPTGSNIPRRNPKRSDIPTATSGQLGTLLRGTGAAGPSN